MAWWDAKRHKASPPSRRKQELSLMDCLSGEERQLRRDVESLPAGVMSPITEEEVVPSVAPPLVVQVSVRFTDPVIRSQYDRSYGSSQNFTPSDRICKGLLRRIDHCCEELITRKDSGALNSCHEETRALKRQRYEIAFRIFRRGNGLWAERTFKSYQKQPLTVDFTKQVILATHRMVGLFLKSHDKNFRWLDGSVREDHQGPDTVTPSSYGPPSSCSIPRSRFLDTSQSFESIPGYTIKLSFKSRTQRPARAESSKVSRINSDQNTPLNLFLAEELLWDVSGSVQSSLAIKKREFDEEHRHCEGFEGLTACPHLDDDAVRIDLRITNNLGPSFDHLHREFRSRLTLFRDSNLRDSLDFIRDLETRLERARDDIDDRISLMNDFELRLLELKSPSWSIREPVKVSLDPSASYSRRTIEAVLERVQTGVSDVLRGNNIAVHMAAYKRGHLVLDKALVARQVASEKRGVVSCEDQKEDLVARLRNQIRLDIDKVCRDTCSLDGIPFDDESMEAITTTEEGSSEENTSAEMGLSASTGERAGARTGEPTVSRPMQRVFSLSSRSSPRENSSGGIQEDRKRIEPQATEQAIVERRISSDRTASTSSRREGTDSPRVFPLVPARYSMASRSSTGSTLASQLSELLPTVVATDSVDDKDNSDIPALDPPGETAEHVPHEQCLPDNIASESTGSGVTQEQGDALPMTMPLADAACWPENTTEENVTHTKTATFELGPPITLAKHAEAESPSRDWDSCSSDTADDDDDSGAMIAEPPQDPDLPCMDDFARSRIDVMETSQYLPSADNNDEDVEEADVNDLPRLSNGTEDGEPATAPSTPGLSSGCDSSPRNSILITPTILRSQALIKDGILAVSALDYAKAGPSECPDETSVQDGKYHSLDDVADMDVADHGEPSLAVMDVRVENEDISSPDVKGNDKMDEEQVPPDAQVAVFVYHDEPESSPKEVDIIPPLTVSNNEGTSTDAADEHVESALDLDGRSLMELPSSPPMASVNEDDVAEHVDEHAEFALQLGDAAMLELPPSPPMSSMAEAASEIEDTEVMDGNAADIGVSSLHDDHASESGKVDADTLQAEELGSAVSKDEVLDASMIQLPPSPKIEPSAGAEEAEAIVGEDVLEALSADMVGNASLVEGILTDGDPSEAVALPELAGCEPERIMQLASEDPRTTTITGLENGPSGKESEAGDDDIQNITADVESRSFPDVPDLPAAIRPEVSDSLIVPCPITAQTLDSGGKSLNHGTEATVVLQRLAGAVDLTADQLGPEHHSQTAASTSSFITALEIPNPFDNLPSELDSVSISNGPRTEDSYTPPSKRDTDLPTPPPRLALSQPPTLHPSHPPSPVSSHYSFESASYCSSDRRSIAPERDSVDTVAPSTTEEDEPAAVPEREYRPSTAGWLGFREANLNRRFSLPLQYLWDPAAAAGSESSRPGTPGSTGTVKGGGSSSRRERRVRPGLADRPRPMSSGALLETTVEKEDGGEGEKKKGVLPKVVMLFAGMAFASKVLNGDGQ